MLDMVAGGFIFIFGTVIGSFINVVILRHFINPDKVTAGAYNGRSRCPGCHKILKAIELVPIISFIIQRGRCRSCRQTISVQYPLIELAVGLSAVIIFTPWPIDWLMLGSAGLMFVMTAIFVMLFVIDFKTMLLPDSLLIALALVVVCFLRLKSYEVIISGIYGALIGFGCLGLLWLATSGRGLGLGDVKLMIPLGLLFGPINTVLLLFLSFVAGGVISVVLLTTGRVNMKTPVPFGPFLTGVAIFFLLAPEWPQMIIERLF